MRAQSVVIENEMLEGNMGGEKGHKRCLGIEAECIVVQVDSMEIWEL